jgi:hypothetical protein
MAEDSLSRLHPSGIQLVSIPMLEDQSNWEDWIRNAKGWLADHDYDEAEPPAPGIQTRSANEVDPHPKALAAWKKGQKRAVAGLKSRCGKRAYGLVKTIEKLLELLKVLEADFKPKGEGLFNEIYNRWENVNLEDCKDVNDYCTQFDQIRTELSDLDPKCVFPRPILVRKFLQGLGSAFSSWEMSFYQQHSIIGDKNTPRVTLLEAQSGARVEEQRLKGNNATVAMLATNQFRKRPRQANSPPVPGGRWCYKVCGHSGHWDKDCWVQHPEAKLIWEAQNPEKAARRAKRTRTSFTTETPSISPTVVQAHVAIAAT